MAGRIPQSFIDDLLNRIDIVEVIDKRVPLKKGGRDYVACCPFHNEKTPSFTVSQTKQFYHCFGCGAHGSAIGFLMEYDHLEFPDAIEELARSIGVEVPREGGPDAPDRRQDADYADILNRAEQYYRRQLRDHPEADRAVAYLKERGLSGEIAKRFGIGYAPPSWEALTGVFQSSPAELKAATELGLLIARDDGTPYDRFRDRIMFPIRDRRGRCIGFGGRVLGDEKPKYMNSPESPVFHKGSELYGLFEARKAGQKLERLLVVEGYMDVVALAQFGLSNAVATLGTATTPEHLERLFRTVSEVVFCFDGDAAGRGAAWRALENALPVLRDGREARFLFLPEGEDPDTLVRRIGADAFCQQTVDSVPLSKYFFESLCAQVDTGSVDGKARLVELAKPLLKRLPDSVFRDLMMESLSELSGLKVAQLRQRVFGQVAEAPPAVPDRPQQDHGRSPVRVAVRLLLEQPALGNSLKTPFGFEDLRLAGVPLLVELLELVRANPHLSIGGILEHWRDRPEQRHLARLATAPLDLPAEGLEPEFIGAVQRLTEQRNRQKLEDLLEKDSRSGLTASEKSALKQLLAEIGPNRGGTGNI
jgi:DNA primase